MVGLSDNYISLVALSLINLSLLTTHHSLLSFPQLNHKTPRGRGVLLGRVSKSADYLCIASPYSPKL